MAIALGVDSKGASGSSLTQATGAVTTQAAGSLLLAAEVFTAGMATFSTLADSKSNTYTLIGTQQAFAPGGGSGGARLHYKENGTGGASHTATFTNTGTSSALTVLFAEFTGVLTSGALDTNAQSNDTASPFTCSITPSAGNRVLVALFGGNSGSNPATHAESSGFTVLTTANEVNGATFWTCCLAYRLVAADGVTAYTASFTETGGTDTAIVMAAFKEASGTPATLTSATPSGTLGTTTTATLGADTDQTTGTGYGVVDTAGNIAGITAAQVIAGQNNVGGAALAANSAAIGASPFSIGITGLTQNTLYSYAIAQNNVNGNSNVVTGTFTTAVTTVTVPSAGAQRNRRSSGRYL